MFLSDQRVLTVSIGAARARLANLVGGGWLGGASQAVYQQGMEHLVRVGPVGGLPGVSRLVRVQWLVARRGCAGCALGLLCGCEWRAGRVTPPAVQEGGGALTGPGERSVRVAERFADERLDRVRDVGEHLPGCGVRS
jgi:hypothetical protein